MSQALPTMVQVMDTVDRLRDRQVIESPTELADRVRTVYHNQVGPVEGDLIQQAVALTLPPSALSGPVPAAPLPPATRPGPSVLISLGLMMGLSVAIMGTGWGLFQKAQVAQSQRHLTQALIAATDLSPAAARRLFQDTGTRTKLQRQGMRLSVLTGYMGAAPTGKALLMVEHVDPALALKVAENVGEDYELILNHTRVHGVAETQAALQACASSTACQAANTLELQVTSP